MNTLGKLVQGDDLDPDAIAEALEILQANREETYRLLMDRLESVQRIRQAHLLRPV